MSHLLHINISDIFFQRIFTQHSFIKRYLKFNCPIFHLYTTKQDTKRVIVVLGLGVYAAKNKSLMLQQLTLTRYMRRL